MTVVRLRNLIERAPQMSDLQSVTALMSACERVDAGVTDPAAEEILRIWQKPGFDLHTDAWVIVTRTGQIIGYADVRQTGNGQLSLCLRVHPDYRCRGIGTLLLWLAEERARHLASNSCSETAVWLSITVSRLNRIACHFFESEGYLLARRFWRLFVEEEGSGDARGQRDVSMDLPIDAYNLMEADLLPRRTGIYVARQYVVYHKVLRAGKDMLVHQLTEQPVAV